MKVLLINLPCGPRTIGMRYICRVEPLNLEQIGAAVSGEHEVRLVDMQVRPGDLAETLAEFKPDVAGAGTETVRVGPTKEVLRTVKRFLIGNLILPTESSVIEEIRVSMSPEGG